MAFYNNWWSNRAVSGRFLVVRYEDLHGNAEDELRRVWKALGMPDDMKDIMREACAWGSFDNLRALTTHSPLHELAPVDESDPESFKFRSGKVGGYVRYLDGADIAFLDRKMEGLNEAYGYHR